MVSEHGGLPSALPREGHFPLQEGRGDPRCRAHLSGFLLSSLLDPGNPHYFLSSLMPLNTLFYKICSQVFPAAEEIRLVLQSRGSQGPAEDSSGPCTLLPGPWPFLPGPLGLRQDIPGGFSAIPQPRHCPAPPSQAVRPASVHLPSSPAVPLR